jgi:cobalt-zinc-cadmium efflux system protein
MSRVQRLMVVLILNLALVAALVIVGIGAHSLGVLAEGGDYLLDAGGVGLALIALVLSRRPATARRPSGYANATNIAALVNAGWLLLLEVVVVAAAVIRLATGTPEVHGLPVLVVSAVAAATMAAGALILSGDTPDEGEAEGDLSIKAVLLDTVGDAAAAAGVAAMGGIILVTGGWYWLDPAVALVIAVVVGYHALALVLKVLRRFGTSASGSRPDARSPR